MILSRKRGAWLAGLCLVATSLLPPAGAQPTRTAPGPFIDRVDVNVVSVEVFVTDRKGNNVTGLQREDFELIVDGREVAVSNFYAEEEDRPVYSGAASSPSALPEDEASVPEQAVPPEQRLRLVVFVDQTALQPLSRKRSFKHIRSFLEEGLAPGDEVSVISLSPGLRFHCDFTTDREVVDNILKELEKSPALDLGTATERRRVLQEVGNTGGGPSRRGTLQTLGSSGAANGALSLIRAVAATEFSIRRAGARALSALLDTLAGVPGRKAILHVSDGISTNPGEDLFIAWQNRFGEGGRNYQTEVGSYDLMRDFQQIVSRANASKVTFYAVDSEPADYGYGRSPEYAGDPGELPSLTTEVASTYEANKRSTVELVANETGGRRVIANGSLPRQLTRLGRDFRTFYSLGFEAPRDAAKDRHEIRVRIRDQRGLDVRHRTSYSDQNGDQFAASQTMAALLYGVEEDPLGVEAAPGKATLREDGAAVLKVDIAIPFDRLALLPDGETRAATLSLFVTVQDEIGAARPVQRVAVQLRLPEEDVDRAEGRQAHYVLPIVVGPKDRRVALGIRDDIAGIVSTLRLEIDGEALAAAAAR